MGCPVTGKEMCDCSVTKHPILKVVRGKEKILTSKEICCASLILRVASLQKMQGGLYFCMVSIIIRSSIRIDLSAACFISESVCQTFSIRFLCCSCHLFNAKTDQLHMWCVYAL